jgi:RNA polymerase sigma-70 factor (ECF subfamily)
MHDPVSLRDELSKLQHGDVAAAERMIERAYERLQRMAGQMLKSFPSVRRWEETDDVWLTTAVSLHKALRESPPETLQHFYNLAGIQIRRTLIDLARKHNGPLGLNSNYDTNFGDPKNEGRAREEDAIETVNDPVSLTEWEEFHRDVEQLPKDAREIFNLLWYAGLSQVEAADVLGIHYRSVKRRWRQARLLLFARRSGKSLPT